MPEPQVLRTPLRVLETRAEGKVRKVTGLIAELLPWEVKLKVVIGFQRAGSLANDEPTSWVWAHELRKGEYQPPETTTVFSGTPEQFKTFAPMFAAWVDASKEGPP